MSEGIEEVKEEAKVEEVKEEPKTEKAPEAASAPNDAALKDLIGLLIDAANDSTKFAGEPSKNTFTVIGDFSNLTQDALKLASEAADIPAELKSLDPDTASGLVASVQSKLSLPEGKAKDITEAALTAATALVNDVYSAFLALNKAIRE